MPRRRSVPGRGRRFPTGKKRKRLPKSRRVLLTTMAWSALAVTLWALTFGPGKGILLGRFARIVTAEAGSLEITIEGEGLILRKESLYKAPAKGEVKLLLEEGERLRVGSQVLEIINAGIRADLEKQAAGVGERLAAFETKEARTLSGLKETMARTDQEIMKATEDLAKAVQSSDDTALRRAWEKVDDLLKSREEMSREVSSLEDTRDALLEDQSRLAKQMEDCSNVMEAHEAGLLSYQVDGYETVLTPDRGWEITAATVYQADPKPKPIHTGVSVQPGDPVFKVIDSSMVGLALALPSADVLRLAEKGDVALRLLEPKTDIFYAEVREVGKKTGDEYAVVCLDIKGFPDELSIARRVKVQVVSDVFEGTLIPKGALTKVSGTQGVFVVEKATARFIPVEFLGSQGKNVVVSGVSPGTDVVSTPFLVRDGSAVR